MAKHAHDASAPADAYARACARVDLWGRRAGLSGPRRVGPRKTASRGGTKAHGTLPDGRLAALDRDLELAQIPCTANTVLGAARTVAIVVAISLLAAFAASLLLLESEGQAAIGILALICPSLSYHMMMSNPRRRAKRRASLVSKGAPETISLMVMGVRQDSSLPNAIDFASRSGTEFAYELRRCVWQVMTGSYASFEEALHDLGCRWQEFSSETRTALDSIITASCEKTEEGRRRALERANRSVVSGAKRRIEEYTLSLSSPAMMLFGLGILLPIMVGSFMPMLSWDIWNGSGGPAEASNGSMMDVALLMNIVFPAIAFMIALDAVSRHPMDCRTKNWISPSRFTALALLSAVCGTASFIAGCAFFGAGGFYPLLLLTGTLPLACTLVIATGKIGPGEDAGREEAIQDLLFRTGARMLEGENFESSLCNESREGRSMGSDLADRISSRAFVFGQPFDEALAAETAQEAGNGLEGLRIVRSASSKDEAAAGLLAMDIASYLRELADIETTLRMRLKPTLSMMRMSALFMGPLVLGITYGIFLSLGSIGGGQGEDPLTMLVLLGIFLAEMNAIVCYFIWGIQGRGDTRRLVRSIGVSMAVSQLVYAATAFVAG